MISRQTSNPRAAQNGNRLELTFLRVQVGITAYLSFMSTNVWCATLSKLNDKKNNSTLKVDKNIRH
jgi:hypothetical protein